MSSLTALIEAQDALIAALDSADSDQINAASTHMAGIIETIKADGVDLGSNETAEIQVAHARNIDAAKRVNSLTNWTRSKLERVHELRGATPLARPTSY